jgi:hypothetical protein
VAANKYSRGSEWRKWDLQVHTPASHLNNQFGSDWDVYVQKLFRTAIAKNIAAVRCDVPSGTEMNPADRTTIAVAVLDAAPTSRQEAPLASLTPLSPRTGCKGP